MTTRLIIVRHGNTFAAGETPRRVGGRTDLPLVETERGTNVGKYLLLKGWRPDAVFSSPLKRTMETAALAMKAMGLSLPILEESSFREVDYGPDENKTEEEVKARLGRLYLEKEGKTVSDPEEVQARGEAVLKEWDQNAVVPSGWKVSVEGLIETWKDFAAKIEKDYKNKTVLAVSSNGVIRFAPYLTGDFAKFCQNFDIKVPTGGVCVLEKEDDAAVWTCAEWGVKPKKILESLS